MHSSLGYLMRGSIDPKTVVSRVDSVDCVVVLVQSLLYPLEGNLILVRNRSGPTTVNDLSQSFYKPLICRITLPAPKERERPKRCF